MSKSNAQQPKTYSLGDFGNAEDMTELNVTEAKLLSVGDFAFVRRSDGRYSYSVIVEAPKASTGKEPFIKFRLDQKGFTKTIPMTFWAANIKLRSRHLNLYQSPFITKFRGVTRSGRSSQKTYEKKANH
jgi:hypothetical protein